MIYIGIDNGVTGSIGIITSKKYYFYETPYFSEQNYTKKKGNISRIDHKKLRKLLKPFADIAKVILERPFTGKYAKSNICAARAIESTLIVVETLKIPHQYIDSKEWQKEMLPSGIKGSPALKKVSVDIGCRLFPKKKKKIIKHKDADGLLIAEWARREKR